MTAEQEKYIIEKYPRLWNGVYYPNGCFDFKHSREIEGFTKYPQFAKYMQIVFKLYSLTREEREIIIKDIINKNYCNFSGYMSHTKSAKIKVNIGRQCYTEVKKIVYFLPYIKSYDDFVMSIAFLYGMGDKYTFQEKNEVALNNEKDIRLVWEFIRPDIIYNYCQSKYRKSLLEYFLKLNHTLTKHNKYVYFGKKFRKQPYLNYINIEKRKSYRYLLELLQKNNYISALVGADNSISFTINTQTIAPTSLLLFLYAFNKEMQFYNSEVFTSVAAKTLGGNGTWIDRKLSEKPPYKLQQIFDAVRKLQLSIDAEYKDINEIINQQKTDK